MLASHNGDTEQWWQNHVSWQRIPCDGYQPRGFFIVSSLVNNELVPDHDTSVLQTLDTSTIIKAHVSSLERKTCQLYSHPVTGKSNSSNFCRKKHQILTRLPDIFVVPHVYQVPSTDLTRRLKMCRFEYLYYQCCPREPQFPCIRERYDPFRVQCQASLDNPYLEPCMPERLEDIPWVPLPGPCCCEGRWSDQRSYAYGPNGDGSIEGPNMAVLLGVIREGKVSAARRRYFPDCQDPAPPAGLSTVLPAQQTQLLADLQRRNVGGGLMAPGAAAPQMPIQQHPYAPGGARQYLPGLNPASGRVMAPPHQPGQIPVGIARQQGQAPVPWPSTLVGQLGRPQNFGQGLSYSRTDRAGRPMPVSLPQRIRTGDDAMAWYNSDIFLPTDAPTASIRPRQGHPPARQSLPPARQQPPSRQQPAPVRQQPPAGRKRPRLHSPFRAAGPNVPLSQQQPHPQPRGYDPLPAQNYFELINETEQRNMRPNMPSASAPTSSSTTAGPSTSRLDPRATNFTPASGVEAGASNAATAPEQPATSGDWTRNIQPQWKRQPGAWKQGE